MANPLASYPRHLGSNTLNHLLESNFNTSREAIKADLAGKIIFDDNGVLRRLRVHEHENDFVTRCAASLTTSNAEDIALLKLLVAQASKTLPEQLEKEESEDVAGDQNKDIKSGNHGCAEERRMYGPLVNLFNHIAQFQTPGFRKFEKTNGMLKADEHHTFGFPSVSPDITIALEGVNAAHSKKWRHREAFGEVKPSNKLGPKSVLAGTIPSIVTQCADYARLFMSARPFMLFCVAILIFGTEFCVGIFDRDGVTFSPIYDMFKDPNMFVRVVRSLACTMSIQDLGHDPTTHVLKEGETENLTGQNDRNIYPSALVSYGKRQWCTIGPPIWTSLSFLGRGTNVWRVKECIMDDNSQQLRLKGEFMIMKMAWRSSDRTSESEIYLSIPQPHPIGLAKFNCGGDVEFPLNRFPITVKNLRSEVFQNLSPVNETVSPATPVLHRIILLTIGRPMWEYKTDLDLLTGYSDAIRAHKTLYDMGILHRDISAGNILLTEKPNGGFITDLDYAYIQDPTMLKRARGYRVSTEFKKRTHTTFQTTVPVKRGAFMTGTAQFMAMAIPLEDNIEHEGCHDVESFIWVFSYCVMRNILGCVSIDAQEEVKQQSKSFRNIFSSAFAQTNRKTIERARHSKCSALTFPQDRDITKIVKMYMSETLLTLFHDFRLLIHGVEHPDEPAYLTHEDLLKLVDKAISSL